MAGLVAACGNDDDNGNGNGDEEAYVAGMCNAFVRFEEGLDDLFESLFDFDLDDDIDEEQLLEQMSDEFVDIMLRFADDIEDLNPPSDLNQFHSQVVSMLDEMRDVVQSDDFDLMSMDDPFEHIEEPDDVPDDVREKYRAIAEDIPECADIDLFEEGIL